MVKCPLCVEPIVCANDVLNQAIHRMIAEVRIAERERTIEDVCDSIKLLMDCMLPIPGDADRHLVEKLLEAAKRMIKDEIGIVSTVNKAQLHFESLLKGER